MSDTAANPMRDAIQEAIAENRVILFMKGTPDAPACGFSARTVGILQSTGVEYAAVDIIPEAVFLFAQLSLQAPRPLLN